MPLFVNTNEQYLQTHYFRDIHTDNKNEIFQNEHPLSITEIIEQYPQFIWAYTLWCIWNLSQNYVLKKCFG